MADRRATCARPMKSPLSTTPGIASARRARAAAGVLDARAGSGSRGSRCRCRCGRPASGRLRAARGRAAEARAARAPRRRAKGTTSTGSGKVVPSRSTSLSRPTTMTSRRVIDGDDLLAQERTAAALDHVEARGRSRPRRRSSVERSTSSRVASGIPSSRALLSVSSEVGTPRTRGPRRGCARPGARARRARSSPCRGRASCPLATSSAARRPAARFAPIRHRRQDWRILRAPRPRRSRRLRRPRGNPWGLAARAPVDLSCLLRLESQLGWPSRDLPRRPRTRPRGRLVSHRRRARLPPPPDGARAPARDPRAPRAPRRRRRPARARGARLAHCRCAAARPAALLVDRQRGPPARCARRGREPRSPSPATRTRARRRSSTG